VPPFTFIIQATDNNRIDTVKVILEIQAPPNPDQTD